MSAIGDLLDGPPRHLERYAPPWASGRFTICGRPLDDVSAWLTYDEGRALIAKIGETRARLLLCQTCLSMQTRIAHPRKWESDPVQIVNDYTRHFYAPGNDPAAQQIRAELLAIARLIEAHRDEFAASVTAYLTDEVTARRRAKR